MASQKRQLLALKKKLVLLINRELSFYDISKMLSIDVSNVRRAFYKLIKLNLITKKRVITQAGIIFLNTPLMVVSENAPFFRLHNLMFTVKIERAKSDLYKKLEKTFEVKPWLANKVKFRQVQLENIVIRFVSDTVCLYLPEILETSPETAKDRALEVLYRIMSILEQKLNLELSKDIRMPIVIGSQHIAIVNEYIAKAFIKAKIKLEVRDKQGNLRAIIDSSKGYDEFEFISSQFAEQDARKWRDLVGDVIINNAWQELKEDIRFIKENLIKPQKKTNLKPDYIG